MEVNIFNLFGFIFKYNIFKWGENFVEDRPNFTFEKLEQTFCKWFKTLKNNEEVYMQLWNIQQPTIEHVEVYYEHLIKLANFL